MSFESLLVGNVALLRGVFMESDSGDAIDPDAVYLSVTVREGKAADSDVIVARETYQYQSDVEVARVSEGEFTCELPITIAGYWHYEWWSTGDGQAVGRKYFLAVGEAPSV